MAFIQIISLIFGATFGSFLNVCIYRLPNEESIVKPRSKCPHCEKLIPWYFNLPVLSYLFLRGRCGFCKRKISFQYPFIEILTALTCLEVVRGFGPNIEALIWFLFCCSMIVIAFIDISHRIIPNVISLPGILIGFVFSIFNDFVSPVSSLIGLLIGGGVLYSIAWFYKVVRKVDGMGMGDVKLLAMIGAFLGWQSLLFVVLVSSLTGTVIGISFILMKRLDMKYQIPFGTFLAFSAMIYLLYGYQIIGWYNRILVGQLL